MTENNEVPTVEEVMEAVKRYADAESFAAGSGGYAETDGDLADVRVLVERLYKAATEKKA